MLPYTEAVLPGQMRRGTGPWVLPCRRYRCRGRAEISSGWWSDSQSDPAGVHDPCRAWCQQLPEQAPRYLQQFLPSRLLARLTRHMSEQPPFSLRPLYVMASAAAAAARSSDSSASVQARFAFILLFQVPAEGGRRGWEAGGEGRQVQQQPHRAATAPRTAAAACACKDEAGAPGDAC